MTCADWETVRLPRLLTPDQASELVGTPVPVPAETITRPTVGVDDQTGEPIFAYLPLDNVAELRRAVVGLPMTGVQRSKAFRSRSRTFGAAPRKPAMRRDGCRMTALFSDEPERHKVLQGFADQLGATIKAVDPRIPERDRETLGVVKPEWRMGEEELWTSGVINQSATLPYHRDNFNFKTWSAMPVVRRGMRGGHLSIPEYGVTLACADGTASYFCGRELVHGVTPMTKVQDDGYRYSVVYYALRGMKDCFTAAVESEYARTSRTNRERAMAKRIAAGDMSIPGRPSTPEETP